MGREVEFSKTAQAKQSKVRVTWVCLQPSALRWAGERSFAEKVATELGPNQKHEKSECETVEEANPTKGVLSLKKKMWKLGVAVFVA